MLLRLKLSSDTQVAYNSLVPFNVSLFQMIQQFSSSVDHPDKTVSRMMVLSVSFEMICKIVQPLGQKSDLDLRGPCVTFV